MFYPSPMLRAAALDERDNQKRPVAAASALDRRIDSAARHICGDGRQRTGTRIVDNAKMRVCVAEVKARAASQVAAVKQERQLGG